MRSNVMAVASHIQSAAMAAKIAQMVLTKQTADEMISALNIQLAAPKLLWSAQCTNVQMKRFASDRPKDVMVVGNVAMVTMNRVAHRLLKNAEMANSNVMTTLAYLPAESVTESTIVEMEAMNAIAQPVHKMNLPVQMVNVFQPISNVTEDQSAKTEAMNRKKSADQKHAVLVNSNVTTSIVYLVQPIVMVVTIVPTTLMNATVQHPVHHPLILVSAIIHRNV